MASNNALLIVLCVQGIGVIGAFVGLVGYIALWRDRDQWRAKAENALAELRAQRRKEPYQ